MFDKKITAHLAELSKIEFSDEELSVITKEMDSIINLMDKVKNFNNDSPSYALRAREYKDIRQDEAKESFETDKILQNAKAVKNNSFVVPKVV